VIGTSFLAIELNWLAEQSRQPACQRHLASNAVPGDSALASIRSTVAQPTPQAPGEADFLFVQSSKGLTFDSRL